MTPRKVRLTIRTRLTLIYGGTWLAATALLLSGVFLAVSVLPSYSFNGVPVSPAEPSDATAPFDPTGRPVASEPTPTDAGQADGQDAGQPWPTVDSLADLRSFLLLVGIMGLLAGAVPAFGTGWLLAGRMLAPIGRVTRAAATIAAGNLHRRVDLNGPYDEVKQLADTFDDMLSRLERAFEAQRRFTANASHELLTPLAVARAVLETGTPGPDTAKLLELNERSEHTVVALLTLARADQAPAGRDPVDLRALVADAVTRAQPSATVAGVTVETDLADAVVGGDPMLCAHLADNLLANAVRYNHPGGQVVVSLVRRPDRSAALTVVNTGPVVAADSVAGLFEPFVRAEGRSNRGADGGHGLGMAIVRAVVQAHGGTVTAAANPEGGLTVTAAFPGCITGTAGRI